MRTLTALASLALAWGMATTALAQTTPIPQTASLDLGTDLPQTLAVADGRAYVGVSRTLASGAVAGGLRVVDLSDPGAPRLAGGLDADAPASHVAVGQSARGRFVFMANGRAGLRIVNASDPAAPAVVADVAVDGAANYLRLSGDRLYVATGALSATDETSFRGLIVYDVRDPARPTELGRYAVTPPHAVANPLYRSATGVDVSGTTAYVAASMGGVFIVDVSDPAAPRLLSHYLYAPPPGSASPNVANDVKVIDGYMFVGQM